MSDLIQQIDAAYRADWANGCKPVTGRDELPVSYDAITDAWLQDVLCSGHAGADVLGHGLGPLDDGSTNRRKIQVDYNDAGRRAKLPERLFCKATHDLANRMLLGHSGGVRNEVIFYRDIRPHLDIECPRAYHSQLDPISFNSLIMLGDISADVIEFCDHRTDVTRKRAESQVRLLAGMHAAGYRVAAIQNALKTMPTWKQFFQNVEAFGLKEGSEAGFQDAKGIIPDRLFARAGEIWPVTLASIEIQDALPATLTHGDVHLKNWYVTSADEMGLADWQCANRGHWSRDFAYAVSSALTVENRRMWERDLLRLYLAELARLGGPEVGFDQAWLYYRQQLLTVLTWWTITLHPAPGMPDMQPRDVTEEFVRRIATAMDDVGSLDAF